MKTQSLESVILLDEVDKSDGGIKGNLVEDALLEILDTGNSKFVDHFIGLPVDLSSTLFIATCNDPEEVSKPLMDRMQHIAIDGYSASEKYTIVKEYLLPEIIGQHGLTKNDMEIDEDVIWLMVRSCPSSGVRDIEKTLARICQHVAYEKECSKQKSIYIDKAKFRIITDPTQRKAEPDETDNEKPHPVFMIKWSRVSFDFGYYIARYASERCPDFRLVREEDSSFVIALKKKKDAERLKEMCWKISEQVIKAWQLPPNQIAQFYQIEELKPLSKSEFNASRRAPTNDNCRYFVTKAG
ncbi:MAG: AAA family ATPase [Ruminiclostridium sp.]|nr:AAA family ATPase [Ruminiclostridium sp.]